MRTMPEIAAITVHITSPSCAIWPLISCPRNPPRAPCVSKSNGPVGRTPISQSSSPKSEVRLPCDRLVEKLCTQPQHFLVHACVIGISGQEQHLQVRPQR